jgi:uncharacterized protein (DUF1330 family)
MSAYMLLEIDWHDQAKAKEYREKLTPVLEKYGGRTLYAGVATVLEGTWKPPRLVLFEFPTMERLRTCYASPEYAPLLKLRLDGAANKMLAFEQAPP